MMSLIRPASPPSVFYCPTRSILMPGKQADSASNQSPRAGPQGTALKGQPSRASPQEPALKSQPSRASSQEIDDLLAIVVRDLADAGVAISADWRYGIAI